MAEDFKFTNEGLDQVRDYRRLRNRRTAERIFRLVGAGAETMRTGASMADTLAKRPLSGDYMTRREKLGLQKEILPAYAGKESQQQALGYQAINDHMNRQLEMSKAAMQHRRDLAEIKLRGSIASIEVQDAREARQLKADQSAVEQANNPSQAAFAAASTTEAIIGRHMRGAAAKAIDAAYEMKIQNALDDEGFIEWEGNKYPAAEIPAGVRAKMREEAAKEAVPAGKDALYSMPDEQRQYVVKEIAGAFKGSAYENMTEYDKAHLVKLTANQMGISPGELVAEFERFDPEAAQSVTTNDMRVAKNLGEATMRIESDNYRRMFVGNGQLAAGADTRMAEQTLGNMYTLMEGDPSLYTTLPPYMQASVGNTFEKAGRPLSAIGVQGVSTGNAQAVAEAPGVDVSASDALADAMGAAPKSAIDATNEQVQAEQAQAAEAAQQPQEEHFINIPLSTIRERQPDFQVPSDAVGRIQTMLQVIEDYAELPAAQQARKELLESPMFAEYKKMRGYQDSEYALRRFMKESRVAQRKRVERDRETTRRNVRMGLETADPLGPSPAKNAPSREDERKGWVDVAAAGVPDQVQRPSPDAAKATTQARNDKIKDWLDAKRNPGG